MDKKRRKDLARARMEAQEKAQLGGIYAIENRENGKRLLVGCVDLTAAENRFMFSKEHDNCLFGKLFADWEKYGKDAFSFVMLEELRRGEEQTLESYRKDLTVLHEMWEEKLDKDLMY
ncbi:GIY-YIG nuclease family protein [Eubacteriales bacterium OttesenSCG-928-M02]|nr:GIY-YIG nuclease family protein [Eubacteriales bacterium OttesenSCG-928-M02]